MTIEAVMNAVARSSPELRDCPFCGKRPRVVGDIDPLMNAYSVEIYCDCRTKIGPKFYNAKLAEDAILYGSEALQKLASQWNGEGAACRAPTGEAEE
ncbi:MAG: Lar family restriction alleviation protein [Oscillospiraceae bacterium]|jgi:hypothetical protein|nr:Lar family restriction alleviation protein [Oscillospiraceae bacterium]